MHALPGFAAIAIAAATFPAAALAVDDQAFAGRPAPSFQDGFVIGRHDGDFRHHHGRFGDAGSVFVYDRDWQGDSAWRSDSFNDWWHDQPSRAYPHWMLNNQNCEKRWYQGDVLRC